MKTIKSISAQRAGRALLVGAAMLGLAGCVYGPAPYAAAPGVAYPYAAAPVAYPDYGGYYGGYYGPSIGLSFGGGGGGGYHRDWR
jgi:hypothetical protein